MGGSMGSVVGEKVTRAAEAALEARIPYVTVGTSGGARMQEGTLALMQLVKTCAAVERLAAAGVPYISVMSDPTTGGVFASFAALGDVNLAEPNALIGFAGARVAAGTTGDELPEGFQRAEFLFRHGFVDEVVPRAELRDRLTLLLRYLQPRPERLPGGPGDGSRADLRGRRSSEGDGARRGGRPWLSDAGRVLRRQPRRPARRPRRRDGRPAGRPSPPTWPKRLSTRPSGRACRWRATCSGRTPWSSSRPWPTTSSSCTATAPSATTRRSWAASRASASIASSSWATRRAARSRRTSGATSACRTRRAIARPPGSCDWLSGSGLPVVTFVDTPGAAPDAASEERGQAEAIARSIALMTALRTPIVTVITGEGGSGGALAIAVGDVVMALENAIYSVISPEGCASILWRTPDAAQQAAVAMRLTAREQQALGVIDIVIAEPPARRAHATRARRRADWARPSRPSSTRSSTATSMRSSRHATLATVSTAPSRRPICPCASVASARTSWIGCAPCSTRVAPWSASARASG